MKKLNKNRESRTKVIGPVLICRNIRKQSRQKTIFLQFSISYFSLWCWVWFYQFCSRSRNKLISPATVLWMFLRTKVDRSFAWPPMNKWLRFPSKWTKRRVLVSISSVIPKEQMLKRWLSTQWDMSTRIRPSLTERTLESIIPFEWAVSKLLNSLSKKFAFKRTKMIGSLKIGTFKITMNSKSTLQKNFKNRYHKKYFNQQCNLLRLRIKKKWFKK